MSRYITSKIEGRLGNIMFQIAHTYVISKKYSVDWGIPRHDSNLKEYEYSVFRSVPFYDGKTDDIPNAVRFQLPFRYKPAPEPIEDKVTIYIGWRQSEKFFEERSKEIREMFGPTKEFIKKTYKHFPELTNGRVCAINVRRGDYLSLPNRHPVVTKEYLLKAVESLKKKPDTIFVISDDLQWCKDNLYDLHNVKFIDWSKLDALWLLSLCHDFIISNSTFSWWAQFLSCNLDKQIIAPSTWFGPQVLAIGDTPEDIYSEDWTIIPTTWKKDGFIHLK